MFPRMSQNQKGVAAVVAFSFAVALVLARACLCRRLCQNLLLYRWILPVALTTSTGCAAVFSPDGGAMLSALSNSLTLFFLDTTCCLSLRRHVSRATALAQSMLQDSGKHLMTQIPICCR